MKRRMIALLLAISLLLSGCGKMDLNSLRSGLTGKAAVVPFESME